MSETNHNNFDSDDDRTALDRVRQQIERVLGLNDSPTAEERQQLELKAEVERLLAQYLPNRNPSEDEPRDDDISLINRLIEIKGLLERQEIIYKKQQQERERRNRAISEYLVLLFCYGMGAATMLIMLRF